MSGHNYPFDRAVGKDDAGSFSLPGWIELAPFEVFLGMEIVEAAKGRAVLNMPFRVAHCQGMGLMHGGAEVALADTALAIAIKTVLPEGSHFATIDLQMKFHAPVRWGTLTARAEITERSERDIHGQVVLMTEEGVKAATFYALFRVKRT